MARLQILVMEIQLSNANTSLKKLNIKKIRQLFVSRNRKRKEQKKKQKNNKARKNEKVNQSLHILIPRD